MIDLSDTTVAKSDQLNAEDLIASDKVIKVTKVVKYSEKGEVKYYLNYEGDDGRPFKPCLIMRRLMNKLWGEDGSLFIGRLVGLYCDPDVDFGKQKGIGGIRINGLSNIQGRSEVKLNVSRGVKKTFIVDKLDIEQKQRAVWPDDKFNAQFDKMKIAIETGKSTVDSIVTFLQKTADLTEAQIDKLNSVKLIEQQSDDDFFGEGE